MKRYNPTERIGVSEVEKIFLKFNWIPRTVFQTDIGIDMIVEICKNRDPIGKFVGVQIKTGNYLGPGTIYFQKYINNVF